jgi:hypothetical protein
VVLLTDAPPDRYLPLQEQDDHFLIVRPRQQDFKWNKNAKDLSYKRFKMMQLNYIDLDTRLDSIELVYYLDIDIVIGAPMKEFFDHVEEKYGILGAKRNDTSVSKAFFFKGNYPKIPIQGGQFILERPHSKYCMEQWLRILDTTPNTIMDQKPLKFLMEKIQNGTETKCELVIMEQMPHLFFPRVSQANTMEKMLNASNFVTLNHFKNTHNAKLVVEEVQERFIAALLNMTQAEGDALGVAKKILFQPSGLKWTERSFQASNNSQTPIYNK